MSDGHFQEANWGQRMAALRALSGRGTIGPLADGQFSGSRSMYRPFDNRGMPDLVLGWLVKLDLNVDRLGTPKPLSSASDKP